LSRDLKRSFLLIVTISCYSADDDIAGIGHYPPTGPHCLSALHR